MENKHILELQTLNSQHSLDLSFRHSLHHTYLSSSFDPNLSLELDFPSTLNFLKKSSKSKFLPIESYLELNLVFGIRKKLLKEFLGGLDKTGRRGLELF
mmetsp:Transcript_2983/g.2461  ORF Transcript_2983/g.2461 Transcript_2983/m.2461 type:complete len:99 (+) Transcript_2983:27-323(+)